MAQHSSFQSNFEGLMNNPELIRNICILAHVDHGKTTFADSLIASNGIISFRDVGKLNYLDFREYEQIKRITMKSSGISLIHSPKLDPSDHFLINLIDTPGHIDFSAEVSTAVRLSDGAFLIIDVIEGICPQTRSVIKQIYLEHLSPCLVLNKIDKLLLKLHLTPTEAFNHLFQLLEQVNALMASFGTFMTSDFKGNTSNFQDDGSVYDSAGSIDTECNFFFSPLKGNVMFASSYDGWGFKLDNFVHILSEQLGYSKKVLSKTLWGDYFFNSKIMRILPNASSKGKKNLFATFILDSIWSIYNFSIISKDMSKISSVVGKLKLEISMRLLKHSDNRLILQSIMQQWLPLADAAFSIAIDIMPSPRNLSELRIERFFINYSCQEFEMLPDEVKRLKQYFQECTSLDDVPQVTFVSKMMPFPYESMDCINLNENSLLTSSKQDKCNSCLIAFARVICGTIRKGQTLYALHPRYNPAQNLTLANTFPFPGIKSSDLPQSVSIVNTGNLYIFMGRQLKSVPSVPAGNICGISELDTEVLRNCSLSNTLFCIPFCPIYTDSNPILKVSIETLHISDMESLILGLDLLAQVDPCVEIGVEETGERVISCAGEVHLKKCIEDLKSSFALNIDFDVSAPIIPFRETIIEIEASSTFKETFAEGKHDKMEILENPRDSCGYVLNKTPNKEFEIAIRAFPLPSSVIQCLEHKCELLRVITSIHSGRDKKEYNISKSALHEFSALRKKLQLLFQNAGVILEDIVDRIWSFGPKANCPNMLVNNVQCYNRISIWPDLDCDLMGDKICNINFDSSVVQGFQLATIQGPLCNEPITGVCFIVESIKFENLVENLEYIKVQEDSQYFNNLPYGPLSGQIISVVTKTCKQAFLAQPSRLMHPIYSCSLLCTQGALGSMMAVINRRGGKCICQEVEIGTNNFIIDSYIPVIESFGFSDEIRKKTSGLAIPQLIFSHWEILRSDPFWVPSTAEELLHYGAKADYENPAKKYMDNIRKRKGLPISSKLVEFGEKQRNIKK